jgi:hypothetical protein
LIGIRPICAEFCAFLLDFDISATGNNLKLILKNKIKTKLFSFE